MEFPQEVGVASVHRARRSIAEALGAAVPREAPGRPRLAEWEEPGGAFVTLRAFPSALLRGCVGYPLPVLPRGEAIVHAARAAAFQDPRFPPVERSELDHLVGVVSLLCVPERIAADDAVGRRSAVVVGRDGLIVSAGRASGLLLPQVAVEERWDAEELLAGTCEKASLPRDAWRRPSTRIDRFGASVFAEVAPGGEVVRELSGLPVSSGASGRSAPGSSGH